MAMLVATSPPPLSINMDSVFKQGHAPPSPTYSSPPHPTSPLSPKSKEGMVMSPTLSPSTSGNGSSKAASTRPSPSAVGQSSNSNALMTSVLSGHGIGPVRPAKDVEEFMSRLPPRVEFVEGSSTGTFAASLEGKYEPINASPKAAPKALSETQSRTKSTPVKKAATEKKTLPPLHTRPIDLTWPKGFVRGSGLINTGNTCFLNSALQCLLHTPPLLQILNLHTEDECRVKNGFCMSCAMRRAMTDSFGKGNYGKGRAFTPYYITHNLSYIAKHFKRGRQEDAHEFLRYAIDSLQKSCLAGYQQKIDHKLAETTWVHKIFGGRLRSRVTCHQCGYNSDTFDSILDLSVDIYKMGSLRDALKNFTAKDYLKGADKYKCEKCKRPVNAEKQFTIHEAPAVLTVHLKRFTPIGRKLQHPIRYDERLSLQPVMSEGQHGPTYTLYGVISHVGGGPNSGHYFAHVRSPDGQWYEMNDDFVEPIRKGYVLEMTNAYMLFYIREKGEALAAVLKSTGLVNGTSPSRKGKDVGEDGRANRDVFREVQENKLTRPFIGPIIPAHILSASDPQSDMLKRRIEVAEREKQAKSTQGQTPQKQASQAARPRQVKPLVEYDDDSEEEEQGEPVDRPRPSSDEVTRNNGGNVKELEGSSGPSSSPPASPVSGSMHRVEQNGRPRPEEEEATSSSSSLSSHDAAPPPTSSQPATSPIQETISPSNFYGSSTATSSNSTSVKRKSPDGEDSLTQRRKSSGSSVHSFSMFGGNPFAKSRIGATLHSEKSKDKGTEQDEERELFRPRKIHKKQFGSRHKFAF